MLSWQKAILFGVVITVSMVLGIQASAQEISWAQYRASCGAKAQEENMARAKDTFNKYFSGRTVTWTGKVASIDNDGLDNMNAYSELIVRVKMSPSNSILADLTLRFPKKMKESILQLNKGDSISFTGKITTMGGSILDHEIVISSFR